MGKKKSAPTRDLGAENKSSLDAIQKSNISSFDLQDLSTQLSTAYQAVYDAQEASKKQGGLAGGAAWQKAVAEYDKTVADINNQLQRAAAGTEAKYKARKFLDEKIKIQSDQPGKKQVTGMPQVSAAAAPTTELK